MDRPRLARPLAMLFALAFALLAGWSVAEDRAFTAAIYGLMVGWFIRFAWGK